jgi:hypothetical protein
VPNSIVHWLSRLANVPRYIEEGLTQLHRAEVIKVVGGRCVLKKSLEAVNICDWVHTHMVARVISEAEALSTEKQEVLQVATTLKGPFSALDLAAANRSKSDPSTGKTGMTGALSMYKSVKRLKACRELVAIGLLRDATDADLWKVEPVYDEDEKEREPGYVYDGVTPAWMIPSALIHQVIGATLFQSHRMEIKRAILMNRAILGFKQMPPMRASCFSMDRQLSPGIGSNDLTAAAAVKKRRARDQNRRAYQMSLERDIEPEADGLPMSCLVTPLLDLDDTASESTVSTREPTSPYKLEQSREYGENSREYSGTIDDEYWTKVALSDFLPIKTLIRIRRILKLYCLVVVALCTDVIIILDGSENVQDALLVVAFVFVFFDLISIFFRALHRRKMIGRQKINCVCDMLVLLIIILEIALGFGVKSGDFLVTRRRADSLFQVLCYLTKFGACMCRLSAETQMISDWIRENPCKWLSEHFRKRKEKSGHAKVVPISLDEGTDKIDAVHEEWRSEQLADVAQRMTHSTVIILTIFTVVTIGGINLTDFSYYPDADGSMQTWVELIDKRLAEANTTLLTSELEEFAAFYSDLEYGPYRICEGSSTCHRTVWASGGTFSQPTRAGYQLDVKTGMLQASFDFTGPAKKEAGLRCLLFVLMMLTTLVMAVAIDYVVNKMVIVPLTRVFYCVRMVVVKLKEHVPDLDLGEATMNQDGTEDECAMLEQAVERVTKLVASSKQDQEQEEVMEWIAENSTKNKLRHSQESAFVDAVPMTPDVVEGVKVADNRLEQIGVNIDDVFSWSLNIFDLTRHQLHGITVYLLQHNNAKLRVQASVASNFVEMLSAEYVENPYHNWRHAVDVHHTVHRKCNIIGVSKFLSAVDAFALQVAAVGHDVGHPGFNNLFLEETSHELTLRYNDRSPLENMHCAAMFSMMQRRPEANILGGFSHKQWKDARLVCIEVILSTDNAKHFEMLKEIQMFYAVNCDILESTHHFPQAEELDLLHETNNRKLALTVLMHGADISNACKPWKICMQWAELVISEFFRQGDEEKRLGIPVQMLNNRDTLNKPSSQVAFIEFFVAPFNKAMVRMFPPLWQLTNCLEVNLKRWHKQRLAEVEMEEEKREATNKQVSKLLEELKDHSEKAHRRTHHRAVSKKDQLLAEATKRLLNKEKGLELKLDLQLGDEDEHLDHHGCEASPLSPGINGKSPGTPNKGKTKVSSERRISNTLTSGRPATPLAPITPLRATTPTAAGQLQATDDVLAPATSIRRVDTLGSSNGETGKTDAAAAAGAAAARPTFCVRDAPEGDALAVPSSVHADVLRMPPCPPMSGLPAEDEPGPILTVSNHPEGTRPSFTIPPRVPSNASTPYATETSLPTMGRDQGSTFHSPDCSIKSVSHEY